MTTPPYYVVLPFVSQRGSESALRHIEALTGYTGAVVIDPRVHDAYLEREPDDAS